MGKNKYPQLIRESGLTIYDLIQPGSELHIDISELEQILTQELIGIDVQNFKGRTRSRSKFLKGKVCEALGYPIPEAFRRGYPKLPGQELDVYAQEKNNLQVWNEQIQFNRRYAILIIDPQGIVSNVRVITGDQLQKYDKSGKLTTKYQAIFRSGTRGLLSEEDTKAIQVHLSKNPPKLFSDSPTSNPKSNSLMSIAEVHRRLSKVEGEVLAIGGTRRLAFHAAICNALGYSGYSDKGTYPDVPGQLIEMKLQMARTIDLGLVLPNSDGPISGITLSGDSVTPMDIRYVIVDASSQDDKYETLKVNKLYVVTGADFFKHFNLMEGKGKNEKLQIHLPKDYFPWL